MGSRRNAVMLRRRERRLESYRCHISVPGGVLYTHNVGATSTYDHPTIGGDLCSPPMLAGTR